MTNDSETIKNQLIELGVPESVAEYAVSLNPSGFLFAALSWVYIFVMIAGFTVGAFLWSHFEGLLELNAREAAAALNGILYYHNFGISGLFGLFGWIFAAGIIVGWLQLVSDKLLASAFVETIIDPKNRLYLNIDRYLETLKSFEHDPREYMKQACLKWIRYLIWPVLILFGLASVSLERELHTYTLYTNDSFISNPLFPWEEQKNVPWSDVNHVELGCNHTTGRNAGDDIVYDITFKDGSSTRPSSGQPLEGTILESLITLDKELEKHGVDFKRWSWLKRNPLHPKCLSFYKRTYSSEQYEALKQLLRIDSL